MYVTSETIRRNELLFYGDDVRRGLISLVTPLLYVDRFFNLHDCKGEDTLFGISCRAALLIVSANIAAGMN